MWVTLKDLKTRPIDKRTGKQKTKGKLRWKKRKELTTEEYKYFCDYMLKKRRENEKILNDLDSNNTPLEEFKVVWPMFIPKMNKNVPDTKYSLNLNGYRNWDFITNNMLKVEYKNMMWKYIKHLPKLSNIHIYYSVYYWKNEPDWMNLLSIQSKFFLDLLVESNILEDDNINNVTESYWVWWQDIDNPRVEIFIFTDKHKYVNKILSWIK